jgi:hypothetical protein
VPRDARSVLGVALAVGILEAAGCELAFPIHDDVSGGVDEGPEAGALEAAATADVGAQEASAADAGGSPYSQAVMASRPVAYYPLDETSGSVAHDQSGGGNDCAYVGAVRLGANGFSPSTKAVHLDGSTTDAGVYPAISCSGVPSTRLSYFHGTQPFTIEGWFSPDAFTTDYRRLFSRVVNPEHGYFAYVHAGANGPEMAFETWSNGKYQCGVGRLALSCGASCLRFFHVAFTYDGTNLAGYVDGELGTPNGSGPCAGLPDAPDALLILGNYIDATCPSCAFVGSLSDFAIYDRALPLAEVHAHYVAAGVR